MAFQLTAEAVKGLYPCALFGEPVWIPLPTVSLGGFRDDGGESSACLADELLGGQEMNALEHSGACFSLFSAFGSLVVCVLQGKGFASAESATSSAFISLCFFHLHATILQSCSLCSFLASAFVSAAWF